jgi:hypothetical protein
MDYALSDDQQVLVDAVDKLLGRHAGPRRAREMTGAHDDLVLDALLEAGFLDVAVEQDCGALEAALITEAAARHLAAANVGARDRRLPNARAAPAASRAGSRRPARPGAVRC